MEHQLYIRGIKKALKDRGLTYEDLATHLKMSESGVKKMLTAKDISFRRILQICECLDILPGALLAMAEKSSIAEVSLTREQEDALLKNKNLLLAFWCVAIEKRGLRDIEKNQRIPAADLKKLLNRLVTLDLLTEKKGIYKPRHRGKFRWSDNSALAQYLNREWSLLTLQRTLEQKRNNASLHRLITTKLSQTSFDSFKVKINELLDEVVRTSEREEAQTNSENLQNLSAVIAIAPKGIFDS